MGCGCNKKNKVTSLTTNQNTTTNTDKISGVKEFHCDILYVDLKHTDLKVVSLYKDTKDTFYLDINKRLRAMMVDYNNGQCPNVEEFHELSEYVNKKIIENAK